jgi:hypothetical protein
LSRAPQIEDRILDSPPGGRSPILDCGFWIEEQQKAKAKRRISGDVKKED